MTEIEKQDIIEQVNATMTLSNMPLTQEDKQRLKDILDGKITTEQVIEEIKRKYSK